MTKEEYIIQRNDLLKKHESELNSLAKDCAFSNNPYKEGDIITDGNCVIKIQSIKWAYGYSRESMPYCVYRGVELKKDGKTPKIKQNQYGICQDERVICLSKI
jgi:hypothetical protein